MDSKPLDGKGNAPRKMKFAPKAPPRRLPKPEVKSEPVEDDNAAQAMDLLRRINENAMRVKPKAERKVPASQVAWFGGVANSSTRTYSSYADGGSSSSRNNAASASSIYPEKEYREPWDYHSYYPMTLPLRRPYSGDPEILDEEEFGEASQTAKYSENSINSAAELGLLEDNGEASMIFVQLPALPALRQSMPSDGPSGSKASTGGFQEKTCGIDEIPEGFMGKMRVYKSGRVKLQLGDTLYDMNPGVNCSFAQDVAAINTAEKYCCVVGEVTRFAVLTPDLDSILDGLDEL